MGASTVIGVVGMQRILRLHINVTERDARQGMMPALARLSQEPRLASKLVTKPQSLPSLKKHVPETWGKQLQIPAHLPIFPCPKAPDDFTVHMLSA